MLATPYSLCRPPLQGNKLDISHPWFPIPLQIDSRATEQSEHSPRSGILPPLTRFHPAPTNYPCQPVKETYTQTSARMTRNTLLTSRLQPS